VSSWALRLARVRIADDSLRRPSRRRHRVVASGASRLAPPDGLVVLAGLAGVGKTELLGELASAGEQVLDLERLASHRGSAFGAIGLGPQPSHAAFERAVRGELAAADPARRLWVEDEGPFIGRVGVPRELIARMETAPYIELCASFEARTARLVRTYGGAPTAELEAAIARSVDRLGPDAADAALAHLRSGELAAAVRVLLPAYDAAYEHRMRRRRGPRLGALAS
jgi:tRNA 2-selenouridine synthase